MPVHNVTSWSSASTCDLVLVLRDDPFEGVGKPEPLRHAPAEAWSRRIDEANRLVYVVNDAHLVVLQARYRSCPRQRP